MAREREASEVAGAARRMIRALGRRVADADPVDLQLVVALRAEVEEALRSVPLLDDVARLVLSLPPGWLFPSPRRPGQHLTPAHLAKLVAAELPVGYTMHSLRHRCATVAYGATGDLRAVQELLGHAKPETTAIYTAVPGAAIRAAVEAAA